MTEIQGKSIFVRVSARFELVRVRVIGSGLYNHAAFCYSRTKLPRNQAWVNLLFSVQQDSILDSILDSLLSTLDSLFAQESRIANRLENRDQQLSVNLLLNGTVVKIWSSQAPIKQHNASDNLRKSGHNKKNATPSARNQKCIISDSICLIL